MVGFKKVVTRATKPKDPESLFLDLRNRSPDIQHLWAHQADLLRAYSQNHVSTEDISFELPTGTGKTLVGLLIGEWRRLHFEERILYLCPTRQLAHQVHEHSSKYGIKTHVFVGRGSDYPAAEYSEYEAGKAIAISTYSGLFNFKPRLNSANAIILDDAHSAENYIVLMWSLDINRYDHKDIFFEIISLFEDKLPSSLVDHLKNDNAPSMYRDTVDMIPTPYFWECQDDLRELLDDSELIKNKPNLLFPWLSIRENLSACNMFVSWLGILIRPWIPPTLSHSPFANTTQRIYMSATLGAGGELERIIGVPKIERLPIPPGWDKQGSGRRFFIFPDYAFKPQQYSKWLANQICEKDRTLVLCPDRSKASLVEELIIRNCQDLAILKSDDIEDSLSPFISNKAALILTNRYDGIDLPGDSCRQLIIAELPEAVNLQERFLLRRLGIFSVLKDRIITRFTQATGRCTRGSTDYSLVILIGQRLFDFCVKKENRVLMHPELQAELEFGLNQDIRNIDDLSVLSNLFFEQEEEWKDAESNIEELREEVEVKSDPRSDKLYSIVGPEVNYQYALWRNDCKKALEFARMVGDELSGREFEGYRALWNYFAGSTAWIVAQRHDDSNYQETAKDLFIRAKSCSKTVSWFSELPELFGTMKEVKDLDMLTGYAIEQMQKKLTDLGGAGKRFETEIKRIQELIENNEFKQFENGLTELGELLGFSTDHPKGTAAPDCVWELADTILLLFEAKSNEEEGGISVGTCRQAKGHYDWAKQNIASFEKFTNKYVIIIGQKTKLDRGAQPYVDDLYHLHISRIREIFMTIAGVLRRIRSQSMKFEEEEIRQKIFEELNNVRLAPENLIDEIEKTQISKLPLS